MRAVATDVVAVVSVVAFVFASLAVAAPSKGERVLLEETSPCTIESAPQ